MSLVKEAPKLEELGYVLDQDGVYAGDSNSVLRYYQPGVTEPVEFINGEPKPYGVIVVTNNYAAVVYSTVVANRFGLTGFSDGFVFVLTEDYARDGLLKPELILPTQCYSNAFARTIKMIPSGVIALNDRVISSYEGKATFTSVMADHIIYDGYATVAAFGLEAATCPTVVLGDYTEGARLTIAEILSRRADVGTAPATPGGFVDKYFPDPLMNKIVSSIRGQGYVDFSSLIAAELPPTSAYATLATLRCVASLNEELTNITGSILTETMLATIIASDDLTALLQPFTITDGKVSSAFDFFEVDDEFSRIVDKFNRLYEYYRAEVINVAYGTLVLLANVAFEEVKSTFASKYEDGYLQSIKDVFDLHRFNIDECLKSRTSYSSSFKNRFGSFDGKPTFTPDNPEVKVQIVGSEVLTEALVKPTCMDIPDVDDTETRLGLIASKMPFYFTTGFAASLMACENFEGRVNLLKSALEYPDNKVRENDDDEGTVVFSAEEVINSVQKRSYDMGYEQGNRIVGKLLERFYDPDVTVDIGSFNSARVDLQSKENPKQMHKYTEITQADTRRILVTAVTANLFKVNSQMMVQYIITAEANIVAATSARDTDYNRVHSEISSLVRSRAGNGWQLSRSGYGAYQTVGARCQTSLKKGKSVMLNSVVVKLYSNPESIDVLQLADPTPVFVDPQPDPVDGKDYSFPAVVSAAVGGIAADRAFADVQDDVAAMQDTFCDTPLAFVNGAYVLLEFAKQIASLDDEYVRKLTGFVDMCKSKDGISDKTKAALSRFISQCQSVLDVEVPKLYYLTKTGYQNSPTYKDQNALAFYLLYCTR
jgi:hypothetical protein